jgi:menaquinone-dependent protoporphyrinogen oxidase
MTRVLVAYETKHGTTGEVAQRVADTLRGSGLDVHLDRVDRVSALNADAVVLGAPVYMGRWGRGAKALLRRHRSELAHTPLAVFAVGPLHQVDEEFAQARGAVDKALAVAPEVVPRDVHVFGGALDPADHPFPFNRMEKADIRDPDDVSAWARGLPAQLGIDH